MTDETTTVAEFEQGPDGVSARLKVAKDLLSAGKALEAHQRAATARNFARKVKDLANREALLKECSEVIAKCVEAKRATSAGKTTDKPVVAPK